MIEASGAEIKESRNVRLGGRASNMFLVTNVDPMALKRQFEGQVFDFFSVFPAKNTVQDIKGPYCETSPLLPYVRKATMSVPCKKGVVNEITEFLCSKGVTLSHLDEYRSGKDVVLECIMHLPTGLAEFPSVDDKYVLQKLEALGCTVAEFGRVEGRPQARKGGEELANASSHRTRRDDFVNRDAAIHVTPLSLVVALCFERLPHSRARVSPRAMRDFFYVVEEDGDVAIDVVAVIVALLCVFIARFFATPGVYAKKSQYFQLPGLTLKFVDDAAKVARGPTLSEIPDVCEDYARVFRGRVSLPLQKRRQQLTALLKMIREHEAEMLAALREDLSRIGVEALYYDVILPRSEIKAMVNNLRAWTGRRRVWTQRLITWPSSQWTEKQPRGCALVCSSWNFHSC